MAGVIENYSKLEIRELVRIVKQKGCQGEVRRRLVSDYGQNAVWSQPSSGLKCKVVLHH
jgi:hypothetical protein